MHLSGGAVCGVVVGGGWSCGWLVGLRGVSWRREDLGTWGLCQSLVCPQGGVWSARPQGSGGGGRRGAGAALAHAGGAALAGGRGRSLSTGRPRAPAAGQWVKGWGSPALLASPVLAVGLPSCEGGASACLHPCPVPGSIPRRRPARPGHLTAGLGGSWDLGGRAESREWPRNAG